MRPEKPLRNPEWGVGAPGRMAMLSLQERACGHQRLPRPGPAGAGDGLPPRPDPLVAKKVSIPKSCPHEEATVVKPQERKVDVDAKSRLQQGRHSSVRRSAGNCLHTSVQGSHYCTVHSKPAHMAKCVHACYHNKSSIGSVLLWPLRPSAQLSGSARTVGGAKDPHPPPPRSLPTSQPRVRTRAGSPPGRAGSCPHSRHRPSRHVSSPSPVRPLPACALQTGAGFPGRRGGTRAPLPPPGGQKQGWKCA